ncbi:hypothetical protein NV379_11175 [Paenibacillus sp. N1-5-1-14]|uniref:hypothetical protein n=1 Tax=Paenibacillus radicibacter TaxID=2972488 RepID=UPI00215973C2|nr:hypothetical protein [Paenibacillus radicibacter]MCR8643222.1 hypothetical protein [Paenibacillus radicibacter]
MAIPQIPITKQPTIAPPQTATARMKLSKVRTARKSLISGIYIVVFFLLVQWGISSWYSLDRLYHYRMDYNLFKDNPRNVDVVIDAMAADIKKNNLKDYIIILGDSVTFSTPVRSGDSLSYFIEQEIKQSHPDESSRPAVFNLSIPAMQSGDIYTLLLKLDERNISTDNVIMDVRYSSFVARTPDPPVVFWLKNDLKYADQTSFQHVLPQLKLNGYKEGSTWTRFTDYLSRNVWNHVPMYAYRDFIHHDLKVAYNRITKGIEPDDVLGDTRPWYEKEGLAELLKKPEYMSGFIDKPFDMTENNPNVYMMNRIFEHQKGKKTLIFMSGINDDLSKAYITTPGYIDNLKKLDAFFASQPVNYVNMQGVISSKLFSDHTHYTKEGYQQLAGHLWSSWNQKQ